MSKNIILIGKMGVGKDYVADYICEHYGYKKYALADSIKKLFEVVRGRKANKSLAEDRLALQTIGKFGVSISPLFWINILKEKIQGTEKVIISDCRFPLEADSFRDFFKIRLCCEDDKRMKRLRQRDGIVHQKLMSDESEVLVDKISADIDVDTSEEGFPEILKKEIDKWFQ